MMYDDFSDEYDRFVNWQSRLNYEMPFLQHHLNTLAHAEDHPLHVLDSACGTGMHAIALARAHLQTAGADLSRPMIEKARQNAAEANVLVEFTEAGFGALAGTFFDRPLFPFDALLCLGNSLPHILVADELLRALVDFAACLRPGGLLFLQNRNFDAVMNSRERWMEPQSHTRDGDERIFLRFYDYLPDGLIDFHILTLGRSSGDKGWQQTVRTTRLRPLLQNDLVQALITAGFTEVACYGNMEGQPFYPISSGNLIVTARRQDA